MAYVIALGRKDLYFTKTSSYDKPRWVNLDESSVFQTAELAELSCKKLYKNGCYFAKVVHIEEQQKMVANVQQADDQQNNINNNQSSDKSTDNKDDQQHDQEIEQKVDQKLDIDLADREAVDSTLDAEQQLADKLTNESTYQKIKFNSIAVDPDHLKQAIDQTASEENVTVPTQVVSDLRKEIKKYNKLANSQHTSVAAGSFYLTVVNAFSTLDSLLSQQTAEGVKQAQTELTSWMNPLSSLLPQSVVQFVVKGGKKKSLKDFYQKEVDK